jgi:hypothetical protein
MHGQPRTVVDGLIEGRGFGVAPVEFENVLVERNRNKDLRWGKRGTSPGVVRAAISYSVIDLIASRAGRKWSGEDEQDGIARGHTMANGPKRNL